jgi:sarcosine oxidase, subunit gamma
VPETPSRRSALDQFSRGMEPNDLIRERTGLWIQRLYAPNGVPGLALPEQPNTASSKDGLHAFWVAPGEWLLVADQAKDIASAAQNKLSDLSHARTVFRLEAATARDILAKSCPLDLRLEKFPPGHCAQSGLGSLSPVSILVHHLEDGSHMDLYVPRSYGQHVYAWLVDGTH